MNPYITHLPSPRRDGRKAVITIGLMVISAAISITAIVVAYVILR